MIRKSRLPRCKSKVLEKNDNFFLLFVNNEKWLLPNNTLNISDICSHSHLNVRMLLNQEPHWVYTERR